MTNYYYFIVLIISIVYLISVDGKIPDYIQVCKQNDPEINKCVYNSIINLKPKLIRGIPELAVPTIDPLHLKKLDLRLGPGFVGEGQNLILSGTRNFQIHDLSVNPKANTYSFTVTVPEVIATGTYEIDIRIGSIPIRGKGPLHFAARSITGRGVLYGKKIQRGNEIYNWYPSMNMKLEIGDYDMKLENLAQGDPTITQVTNRLLNEEKNEVLKSMLPGLEKALIEHILLTANNVAKHFPWAELFPES